jgi:hypothetical protein
VHLEIAEERERGLWERLESDAMLREELSLPEGEREEVIIAICILNGQHTIL